MCIVFLSASSEGNHNRNTLLSPLHSALLFPFITQQESLLLFSDFLHLNKHLSPFVASLVFPPISFPCGLSQEPVCDLTAAVNLEGRPQPSDTLFNALWAPQRLRVFLCGQRAASLIFLHWNWHLNLNGYLQNALWPHRVWVLNALMCSVKIELTGLKETYCLCLCNSC